MKVDMIFIFRKTISSIVYGFCRIVILFLLGTVFFSCGADDPASVSDKAPVISLKKLREERLENEQSQEVSFKVVADRAPKTDLIVHVSFANYLPRWGKHDPEWGCSNMYRDGTYEHWIVIAKGKKSSQEISARIDLNGLAFFRINPLPTIEVVGEGTILKIEGALEYGWGKETLDRQTIPEGFEFAYYEVGEPSELSYGFQDSKIIRVDPPNGSVIEEFSPIKILFDTPPACPYIKVKDGWLDGGLKRVSITEFENTAPLSILGPRTYRFLLIWGHWEPAQRKQSFEYTVIPKR